MLLREEVDEALGQSGRAIALLGKLSAEEEDFVRQSNHRIHFFLCSAVAMIIVALAGLLTARVSHSQMVRLDAMTMIGDCISFILNICVEKLKQRSLQERQGKEGRKMVLLYDIAGGGSSFLILSVIVIWGAYLSQARLANPEGHVITHLYTVFGYASVNMIVDVAVCVYWRRISAPASSAEDTSALNLYSGLVHLGMDLARCVVTMVTSAFMMFHPKLQIKNALADALGSFALCILIGMSATLMLTQAVYEYQEYRELCEERGNPQEESLEAPEETNRHASSSSS